MALGNGNSLGISAKIEPQADKGATDKMVRDLEKDIQQVEKLQFESDGFEGRTSPGGGKGGGMGATGAAGAGGLASKLGGGAAAGAAMIGTVALGGVLAERMYRSLSASSGRLQATNSMLGKAWDMALKPLGDLLGSALQPYAKGALKTLVDLNQHISEDGLLVGGLDWLGETVSDLPSGIANAFMQSGFNQIELLVGEEFEPSDLFSGGEIGTKEVLSFLTFPGITTQAFLGEFGWPEIGGSVFMDYIRFQTVGAGVLLSQPNWDSIGKGDIFSQTFDNFSISMGDLLDHLTSGGGDDTDSTNTTTSSSSTQTTQTGQASKPGETSLTRGRGSGGGSNGFDPDIDPTRPGNQDVQDININMDGRRIWNAMNRNGDNLMDRI